MKRTLALLVLMLLTSTLFTVVPVKAPNPTIKIGVIGPQNLPHWSPAGMKEAAEMARDEINADGGVDVGGVPHDIALVEGHEHATTGPGGTPEPVEAAGEVERLLTTENVSFIIGGFRTETTEAMIDRAMTLAGDPEHKHIFIIDGASTDELIDDRVPVNYAKYKYLFRGTPINSTMLFYTIVAFLQGYAIPTALLPIYGDFLWAGAPEKQVKVAVLTEDLAWTQQIHLLLTAPPGHPLFPPGYPYFLGPHANVTYAARVPATATDLSPWLTQVDASGARLMIHIFSGGAGLHLISQWSASGIKALPVGINVMAQLDTHWATTKTLGGGCEFENVLNFAGTRTPIVGGAGGKTEKFWDDFVNKTGRWPIYTAWGAYDAIYMLKEAIETAGTIDADTLVPVLEGTDRVGLTGRFRFTQDHDVYATLAETGHATTGNVRAMMIQWQRASADGSTGRMEVVWPIDAEYSRFIRLPEVMYPLLTDINYDGKVDIKDIARAAIAFGSYPGHPQWRMEADLPPTDGKVDIKDIATIAINFGQEVSLPLP